MAAGDYTVTVPAGDIRKETACCGSKSGRNGDNFKMYNLEATDSRQVGVFSFSGSMIDCRTPRWEALEPPGYLSCLFNCLSGSAWSGC
jgi:hypothetical protein